MDPRDRLPPFANGVDCAVCGRVVPIEGIRVLASRDDLVFVEVACSGCRSESLGIIVGSDDGNGRAPYGEFLPADDARFRDALPIDGADLRTVREILEREGLDALVGRFGDPPGGATA